MSSFIQPRWLGSSFFCPLLYGTLIYMFYMHLMQQHLDPDLQKRNFNIVTRNRDWRLGWRLCQKWNGSCNLSYNTNTSVISRIFSHPGACLWSQKLLMNWPVFHWAIALCGTGLRLCHQMAQAHLTVLDGGSPPGQMESTDIDLPPLSALKFSEWKSNTVRVHWCLNYYTR